MATKIQLRGAGHLDGDYELDLEGRPLNHYDAHLIKKIAGVRGGEIEEAYRRRDSDMVVALAVIALVRAGKVGDHDVDEAMALVYQCPLGGITVVGDPDPETEAAADAERRLPPPSGSDSSGSDVESAPSSGATTDSTSGSSPETTPTATGLQPSDTSSPE